MVSKEDIQKFLLSCACEGQNRDCIRALAGALFDEYTLTSKEIDMIIEQRKLPDWLGGLTIEEPTEDECTQYLNERKSEFLSALKEDIVRLAKSGFSLEKLWGGVKEYISREEFDALVKEAGDTK